MITTAILEPALPALMKPLVDESLIRRDAGSLWLVPLLIVLVFTLKGLADYVSSVSSQIVAQRTISDLRHLLFSHQLDLSIAAHQKEVGGRMLTRISYDTAMVGEAVSSAWITIIRDSLVLIGLVSFLFLTAWQLALLILMIGPILAYAIRKINSRLRRSSELVQLWVARLSGLVQEAFLGVREIKIFGAKKVQCERFEVLNRGLLQEQIRVAKTQAINVPLVQILAATSVALVIYAASSLSQNNLLSPGEFVAFITAMSMTFEPIRRLTNVNASLQRGLAAAESIFSILDEPSEELGAASQHNANEALTNLKIKGFLEPPLIEFRDVSYKYPNRDTWALRNCTFNAQPSESVILVGASGSGKSTIINLLCGFAYPTLGSIVIDGHNIREIPTSILRNEIALVSQNVLLFDLSVAENLRISTPNASDEEIISALKAADAYDFVSELPQGLQTQLGGLGSRLSGGQRQRLSIARALLKKARILLLDEPTSALDSQSEAHVYDGLSALMKGKTTIIVSHTPEDIPNCHRIIKIDT